MSNSEYTVNFIDMADPNINSYSGQHVQRLMEGAPIGQFYLWEWAGYDETACQFSMTMMKKAIW